HHQQHHQQHHHHKCSAMWTREKDEVESLSRAQTGASSQSGERRAIEITVSRRDFDRERRPRRPP
ncbi:hypothetical protein ALC56_14551, partial [Trachymyrmex septentrionalis]